jgi:uncharacterized membrane protein YhaH (DUF805 family)
MMMKLNGLSRKSYFISWMILFLGFTCFYSLLIALTISLNLPNYNHYYATFIYFLFFMFYCLSLFGLLAVLIKLFNNSKSGVIGSLTILLTCHLIGLLLNENA